MDYRKKKIIVALAVLGILCIVVVWEIMCRFDGNVVGGIGDVQIWETATVEKIGPGRKLTVEITDVSEFYDNEEEHPYENRKIEIECSNNVGMDAILDEVDVSDVIRFSHFYGSPYFADWIEIEEKGEGSIVRKFVENWFSDSPEMLGEYMTDSAVSQHMEEICLVSSEVREKNPEFGKICTIELTREGVVYSFQAKFTLDDTLETWGTVTGNVEMKEGKIEDIKVENISF